ncbi:hypothetical protein [Streptomyces sp. NRRL F-5126]|uniref:hypothetical protein n=1 Tax=Streptomyces sp. NRRL F-5126 TaxID=1463857 RepID=UPI0004C5CA1B|nr:hypothetical protein [Streptomyces sp. NRRL F-5126]
MSSSLRRGFAATALLFPLAALAACGAGTTAETSQIEPDSAATSVGDIKLQNVTVVTQAKPGAAGPAAVTGKIFNNSRTPQTLQSIQLPGTSAVVKLSPAKGAGAVTVPANGAVQLGGKGQASAMIKSGLATTKNGNAQKVVFTLSKTGDIDVRALVVPATGYYGKVAPSAKPTPSAPASPSGSPSSSATGSATPNSSSSATGSTSTGGSPSSSTSAGGGSGITG